MKKTYIAPEMEVVKFGGVQILAGSESATLFDTNEYGSNPGNSLGHGDDSDWE